MNQANREAWNRHADRYARDSDLSLDVVDYNGSLFPTEQDLNLIGNPTGLRILELGAGGCNCGIALARQGADVTCLDLSEEQLRLGRRNAEAMGVNLQYICGDMTDLSAVASGAVDLVLSVCALQYVADLDRVFAEVARVLTPGGRFIFSTEHPALYAVGATELWPADGDDPRYGYRGPIRWKWVDDDDFYFTTYRRPLMDYINALTRAGLSTRQMHELFPKVPYPAWSAHETEIRFRFPSTLVVLAQK